MPQKLLRLLAFVIVSTAGVSLLLRSAGVPLSRTGVDPLRWFLEGRQGGDSWRPALRALDVAETLHERSRGLYEKVFFQAQTPHKGFQYPPTALLPIRAARGAAGSDAYTALALVTWICVPLLMAATLALSAREEPASGRDRMVLVLIVVCGTLLFYPAMRAYRNGQMQTWINTLFAVALASYARGRPAVAGACLALSAMIKPQLGLFALWALVRREWSMLAAFAAVMGVGVVATVAWLGVAPFVDYLDVLRYIAARGETFYPNQSVNGFMNRLVQNGSSVDFGDAMPEPNSIVALTTALSSLFFLAMALIPRRDRERGAPAPLDFTLMGLVATLASPIAWEHHYGVLLPAFGLLARAWIKGELRPVEVRCSALAWTLTANSWEGANVFASTFLQFLQSTLLAGVLVLGVILYRRSAASSETPAALTARPGLSLPSADRAG